MISFGLALVLFSVACAVYNLAGSIRHQADVQREIYEDAKRRAGR